MTEGVNRDRRAYDVDEVDWLAVEFVQDGVPMRLGGDVPSMTAVLSTIGYDMPVQELAARMGTTVRQIGRILTTRLGAGHCPSCNRCLVIPDGVVPAHVNTAGRRCLMGGYAADDGDRVEDIRRWQRAMRVF